MLCLAGFLCMCLTVWYLTFTKFLSKKEIYSDDPVTFQLPFTKGKTYKIKKVGKLPTNDHSLKNSKIVKFVLFSHGKTRGAL